MSKKNMRFIVPLFSFLSLLIFCTSCERKGQSMKWYMTNNQLFKDSLKKGILFKRLRYTIDSSLILSEETYYPNGTLKEWQWYSKFYENRIWKSRKTAKVLFDSAGIFSNLDGFFVLSSTYYGKDSTLVVEIINPPVEKIVIGLRDSIGNNIYFKDAFFAHKTDTTAWVDFENIVFRKGHRYWVDFIILDSNEKTVRILSEEQYYYQDYSDPNRSLENNEIRIRIAGEWEVGQVPE